MIKSSNGETPFSLTYGTKAVIPVEIGMPALRTTEVDMIKNDEALEINFDLLEERREQAAIQEAKSKAKMEKYYNARVRNTNFRPGDHVYRNNKASHAEDEGKLGPKCRNEMGRGLTQRPKDLDGDGECGFDCLTFALVSSKAHHEGCRASRGEFPYWGSANVPKALLKPITHLGNWKDSFFFIENKIIPSNYPELLLDEYKLDKKSFKDKVPLHPEMDPLYDQIATYPCIVRTFPDPIFYLAGLKTTWKHSPKRPVIYHRGHEMDFRSFMLEGVDDELNFLPAEGVSEG
ncbi:hypothetical protein Tco_0393654 [Tanacetum coccineum]